MPWTQALSAGLNIADGFGLFGGEKGISKAQRQTLDWQQQWNNLNYETSERWNQKQYNQSGKQFNQLMNYDDLRRKTDVQFRVQDAKRAGLHPLFALGGGSASSAAPTQFIPGQTGTGSPILPSTGAGGSANRSRGITDALESLGSTKERKAAIQRQARLDKLNEIRVGADIALAQSQAEKNYAEAAAAASNQARTSQSVTRGNDVSVAETYPDGQTEKVPSQITASEKGQPGRTAGKEPLWRKYIDDSGKTVYFLNRDELELVPGAISAYKTTKERAKSWLQRQRKAEARRYKPQSRKRR